MPLPQTHNKHQRVTRVNKPQRALAARPCLLRSVARPLYEASGHMVAIWAGPGTSEHCGSADILGPAGRFYPLGRQRGKERTDGGLLMRANAGEVGPGKKSVRRTRVHICRAAVLHEPARVHSAVTTDTSVIRSSYDCCRRNKSADVNFLPVKSRRSCRKLS